jgi:SAM-dependent methyltransferase
MRESRATVEGLEEVLEIIASDPRLPPNYSDWIRASLRSGGWKTRILNYILDHARRESGQPTLLDVGTQFGSLPAYAAKLGIHAAAVDYGAFAQTYGEIAAGNGVDYRQCDVGTERLPFSDGAFDFVTYTDVLEHHSFSSKRVFREIYRVLAPGGRLIVMTPNHASIYNRIKLFLGSSVNDEFDYFFETCAAQELYGGHHREYTQAEVKEALRRTQFRVMECRVVEQDFGPLLRYVRRHRRHSGAPSQYRDLFLCALGKIWSLLHFPFGRWIWAVGEKPLS